MMDLANLHRVLTYTVAECRSTCYLSPPSLFPDHLPCPERLPYSDRPQNPLSKWLQREKNVVWVGGREGGEFGA